MLDVNAVVPGSTGRHNFIIDSSRAHVVVTWLLPQIERATSQRSTKSHETHTREASAAIHSAVISMPYSIGAA